MIHANIHGPMDGRQQCGTIVTAILVTRFDRFTLPISPINAIFPHSHRKDMMQIERWIPLLAQNRSAITSFKVTHADDVLACIAPIQFFRLKADG